MTSKISHVVLGALLISMFHVMSADWVNDLTRSLDNMNRNINRQIQSFTQGLQSQIQHSVESSVGPALEEVDRVIENLPRDANGRIISSTSGSNTVIVNSGNGVSRSIVSGHTPDGQPFIRDVEERYEGNFVYHNETIYNPRTKTTERIRWKLDLSTPGAKPEIFTD